MSQEEGLHDASSALTPEQVAVYIPRGSGWWYYAMETYWTPPFTTTPDPRDPTIPSGGLHIYDSTGYLLSH